MKFYLSLSIFLFIAGSYAYSQSIAISGAGAAPDSSAALDLQSADKGVLLPRMTQAARLLIQQPATGLLVYQTDSPEGFYFNTGTPDNPQWTMVSGESVFVRNNSVIHATASQTRDLIFGRRDLPGPVALDDRLFWFEKDRGAFRNGLLQSSGWTNIAGMGAFATGRNSRPAGAYTFASGDGASATGRASFSTGTGTESLGDYSFASGIACKANGVVSLASGWGAKAEGIYTQAFGDNTIANTVNCFAVGMYNNPVYGIQTDPFDNGIDVLLRPHFIAGAGQNLNQRVNAMSVHRTATLVQDLQIGNGTPFTNQQSGRETYSSGCDNCLLGITFRTPYPTPPSKVFATVQLAGGHEVYSCTIQNITTTGFIAHVRREFTTGTAPLALMWCAIQ